MAELSNIERDTLSEVGNISLGSAATALSNILGKNVRITTPELELVTASDIKSNYPIPCLVLQIRYLSGLEGENVLVIKEKDALVIASLMMGMDMESMSQELGEVEVSAVGEAMNQMMGYAATSMSEMFNRSIEISPPHIEKKNLGEEETSVVTLEGDEELVQVSFRIEVEDMLDSTLLQVIPLPFAREMVKFLLPQEEKTAPAAAPETESGKESSSEKNNVLSQDEIESLIEETEKGEKKEPPSEEGKGQEKGQEEKKVLYSRERQPLDPDTPLEERIRQLEMVKDVPVEVEVILGRTRVPLGKLFTLGEEGVIELEKHSGEPVEIYVNDMMVGRGEVVVVNGQLGVRVTSLDIKVKRSASSASRNLS